MDALFLARLQFALTIMFHYIFPVLSIGLGVILVIMEAFYLKTKKPFYLNMAQFWTKVFALTFAIGVATGIVMEFEFGTNWATYSRYVGDVFGGALAAEGIFAFFLESGFLAILIFGWNKVGPKMHFFSTLMVCLGAHFSAVWIVIANSWMQTPTGFHIVGEGLEARAQIVDFSAMLFNPSSMVRLGHVILGCWLAGAFLVISVAAYYLIKKRHIEFAKTSLKIGLSLALVSTLLQLISGDRSGKVVAKYQPSKLAAMEAVYHTQTGAGLTVFGVPNTQAERIDYAIQIPKLLSYISFGDPEAEIKGLDQVPKKDWPHVNIVFWAFRIMLAMWGLMFALSVLGVYKWWRGTLFDCKWLLLAMIPSAIYPQIGNQMGWAVAETGRYPWIVYGLLRIADGLSKAVVAGQILGSIIMFGVIYLLLFFLFVYLLNSKIKHGPIAVKDASTPYHSIQRVIEDNDHDNRL
jgi:cytochrome d ubiquinol oxidase subunit I